MIPLPRLIVALLFLLSILAGTIYAQPSDNVHELQQQIQELQNRVNNLQSVDDSFGKRVRSVGRQRASRPEPTDEELTIRFYDLSDVFSVAPQYPAQFATDFLNSSINIFPIAGNGRGAHNQFLSGGGFGGGGGGVFNIPPAQQQPQPTSVQAARVSVQSLVDAVKQTVSPDQWEDTDGEASISILGNTLLISATDAMHEQIANLLDLFREQWGKLKTVSIQAFWIQADSSVIGKLLTNDQENPVVGRIDQRQWNSFYSDAETNEKIAYAATMCGQNGQTLHAVSGRQHYVVLDAEPLYTFSGQRADVEAQIEDQIEQSVSGMKPVRKLFQEGAAIQCSPLATRGGNYVILDVHTRVNEISESGTDSVPINVLGRDKAGGELAVELENRPFVSYRLSTTIRCPNNEVVLAGGMTYDSSSDSDQPILYLFIKTNIHTINEDPSDRKLN